VFISLTVPSAQSFYCGNSVVTECCGGVVNTPGLYLEAPGFSSASEDQMC
jgi:hypothetical protein